MPEFLAVPDAGSNRITNVGTPTSPADATTKAYVDALPGGNVYVQATAPVGPPATYLWVQTGLGSSGTDMTFWVEDGL